MKIAVFSIIFQLIYMYNKIQSYQGILNYMHERFLQNSLQS